MPLLSISKLGVSFDIGARCAPAVDGLSLSIHPRQTVALVGESGCGKSVSAMSILRLVPSPPGRTDGGVIDFRGRDLLKISGREMLRVRGGEIAMIFQEPMTSLNPVYTIGDQIVEAIRLHQRAGRRAAGEIAAEAMHAVGIADPKRRLRDHPHQFSGGMRQRAMIAMALACQPALLLADEPTTALDVTIQAQILELLAELQRDRGMAILLITHDLGVVAENADVVCVMYAGRPVEYAAVETLFETPLHPYTRGLFTSIPRLGEAKHRLTTVDEVVGDPREFERLPGHADGVVPWWPAMDPPKGVAPDMDGRDSALIEITPGHWVGCWRTPHVADRPIRHPDLDRRRSN